MCIRDRREGVLQQRATARELYDEPANLFAADFLGTPPINKLSATMRGGKILLDGSDISVSDTHLDVYKRQV